MGLALLGLGMKHRDRHAVSKSFSLSVLVLGYIRREYNF